MPALAAIASELDALLHTGDVPDYANALNGVQVESDADIVRVAAAVDVRERTVRAAQEAGANLLIVHHGLFWGGVQPLRGPFLRRVRGLLDAGIALYSSHLPLDAHPELGNNVLLARELGLEPMAGFARYRTIDVGVMGESDVRTAELAGRVRAFAEEHGGTLRHTELAAGRRTRRWGICTGAGASSETLAEATQRGIDTLIVGEGPHHSAVEAEERDITVLYAGHYATETLGVRALAEHVARAWEIPWVFIAAPTGM